MNEKRSKKQEGPRGRVRGGRAAGTRRPVELCVAPELKELADSGRSGVRCQVEESAVRPWVLKFL